MAAIDATAITVWKSDAYKVKFNIDGDIHFGLFTTGIDFADATQKKEDHFSVKAKGEIDFGFRGGIGNTFTYGAKVEIRPSFDEKAAIDVDEYYGFIKDERFGALYFGTTKSPASKRAVSAPEFYAKDLEAIEGADFVPLKSIENAKNETDLDYDEDVHKVIYYTPRFYGFELGISFAPDIGSNGKGDQTNAYNNTGAAPARKRKTHKNAVSANINYQNTMNGWEVKVSGGTLIAQGVKMFTEATGASLTCVGPGTTNCTTTPLLTTSSTATLHAWNIGASLAVPLSSAGAAAGTLRLGGGFLMSRAAKGNNIKERVAIVGIAHQIGQFTYGIHYRNAEEQGENSKTDNEIEVGGHYAFNDYLKLSAGIELLSSKSTDKSDGGSGGKGIAFGTILTLNF